MRNLQTIAIERFHSNLFTAGQTGKNLLCASKIGRVYKPWKPPNARSMLWLCGSVPWLYATAKTCWLILAAFGRRGMLPQRDGDTTHSMDMDCTPTSPLHLRAVVPAETKTDARHLSRRQTLVSHPSNMGGQQPPQLRNAGTRRGAKPT